MPQVERFSIQEEVCFKDFTRRRGIKVVVTDLDDTLINTHGVFVNQVDLFLRYCHGFVPEVSFDDLEFQFRKFEKESFEVFGVSRQRWGYVIRELSRVYGVNDFKGGASILNDIFQSVPPMFNGARETLEVFQKLGLRLGLVTHAARTWTNIKLSGHELWPYFEIVDSIDPEVYKYKEPRHWRRVANHFDVDPSQIMAIGDNLRGDVLAASRIRIGTIVFIPSAFRFFNDCERPEGIFEIDKIANLVSVLGNEC